MNNNSYYAYNNEALASCILYEVVRKIKKVDYSVFCLILPILFDNRIVERIDNHCDSIENFINENFAFFVDFSDIYTDLLPVTINSATILRDMQLINFENQIELIRDYDFDYSNSGQRISKILAILPIFEKWLESMDVAQIYKKLNIVL